MPPTAAHAGSATRARARRAHPAQAPAPASVFAARGNPCRPLATLAVLIVVDVLTVAMAAVVAFLVGRLFYPLPVERYWPLLGFALLFPAVFNGAGLYRGPSLAEEMRAIFFRTAMVWLGLMAMSFAIRDQPLAEQLPISRLVYCVAWVGSVAALIMARLLVRRVFAHRPWWGSGSLVLGTQAAAQEVIANLQNHPSRGVKPVGVLLCQEDRHVDDIRGVPVLGGCDSAAEIGRQLGVDRAILAIKGLDHCTQAALTEKTSRVFKNLAVIPDLQGFSHIWCDARDYGGLLGIEIQPALFHPWAQFCKRFWDVTLSVLGLLVLAPLFLVIAVAIKLTSRGPVFYSQRRLGRGGQHFRMWKFRSMVADADARLQEYLEANPSARSEWEAKQKLQHDPRVTKIGRLLRRSSLDELPQLWNVLTGSMSLVGPRPVPDDGMAKFDSYGAVYAEYYKSVRPGMSGLWQVEGRSSTSYDERVDMDMHYIRTWNVWLDWEILIKTGRAVARANGAC